MKINNVKNTDFAVVGNISFFRGCGPLLEHSPLWC